MTSYTDKAHATICWQC